MTSKNNNRKGGCRVSYADVNDSFMLTPTKTTGGNLKQKGGSASSHADVNDAYTLKGGNLKQKGGNGFVAPPFMDYSGASVLSKIVTTTGGNLKQKGGVFVELSPILTSLILLGARAAADKNFNKDMEKKIGSVSVSRRKSTKSSKY